MGKPITFCKRVNISELYIYVILTFTSYFRGCRGRDRMVVGFQTAYAKYTYKILMIMDHKKNLSWVGLFYGV
jgi:hypothetical protein